MNGSGIAPKKANSEYFISKKINKIELTSAHSVTIPGSVHAWCSMHEKNLDFLILKKYLRVLKIMLVMGFQSMKLKLNHGKKKNIDLNKIIIAVKFLNNNRSYKFGEIFKNIPMNTLNTISKRK